MVRLWVLHPLASVTEMSARIQEVIDGSLFYVDPIRFLSEGGVSLMAPDVSGMSQESLCQARCGERSIRKYYTGVDVSAYIVRGVDTSESKRLNLVVPFVDTIHANYFVDGNEIRVQQIEFASLDEARSFFGSHECALSDSDVKEALSKVENLFNSLVNETHCLVRTF